MWTESEHPLPGLPRFPERPRAQGPGNFYETIDFELMSYPQTMLACGMNGESLPVEHGAPLRLRVEIQLGFKMVKRVAP